LFKEFEVEPLASASIAQVHGAVLKDGRSVVVKVLRPGVHKAVQRDVSLLYSIARLAEKYWPESRRFRPVEVVAEFEKTATDELDLAREAANASQLRRNFENSPLLYIPEIYWPYVREDVIVMERISGIPITDLAALKRHNVDLKKLAERGVEIFFTQVFRDSYFHADMHPGNIFVSYENPQDPQYIAVDFGIMGSLNRSDQRYIAENFLGFFKRDYRWIAELHVESGWIPATTRVDEFEAAMRAICEPMFGLPLSEISIGRMLLKLFQTGRRFNMEIQPQLILLQKTLLAVEGLGRQLYPDLDLWSTAKPFLENWVKEQVGPQAMLKKVQQYVPSWAENLPELPGLIYNTLRLNKERVLEERAHRMITVEDSNRRQKIKRHSFLSGFGFALSAVVLLGFALNAYWQAFDLHYFAGSVLVIGLLSYLFSLKRFD